MVIHRPSSFLRRLFRDRRGFSAVTVAVSMPVLFGVAGLGIDTGLWYTIKRQNQSAADAAAISAAYEVLGGHICPTDVPTYLVPAASEAATRNDYTGTAPSVTCPYLDPNNPGANGGVQVTLSQTQNAWFSSWWPAFTTFTIANEAVAVVKMLDTSCILALAPTGTDVEVSGSSSINMPRCSITADSTSSTAINLHDNGDSLAADTLVTPGEVAFKGSPANPLPSAFTLNSPPLIGAPPVADPYASKLTHTFLTTGSGTCTGSPPLPSTCMSAAPICPTPAKKSVTTFTTCKIVGGLDLKNETVNLSPGTYWVTDGDLTLDANGVLECTSCNPSTGAGVTLILTTAQASGGTVGTINMAANATIDSLNAPGSGAFEGLLIVQDSNGLPPRTTIDGQPPNSGTFQGGPSQTLNGLVYFPTSNLTFQGNPATGSNACLALVVYQITLAGNSSLDDTGCTNIGVNPPTPQTVALAE